MKVKKNTNKKLKILIIRFSSIGDIILTTPVIRCINQQLNAEVHFLTQGAFAPLLSNNPFIDKLWIWEKKPTSLFKTLKDQQFDFVIDLHKNLRSSRTAIALNKKPLTFNKLTLEKQLLIRFHINWLPEKHIVDRYMEAVKVLGVLNDQNGLDYFIPKSLHFNIELPEKYIVLSIGANHFTKKMPPEKWIDLIGKSDHQFVLIGGQTEEFDGQFIKSFFPHKVINLCNQTNFDESAEIIKRASLLITNDTGMLHLGAALKQRIFSIWGGTIKEYGYWPYYPEGVLLNTNFEVLNLPCRPCSKFGRKDCPKGHFKCMNEINIDEIQKHINALDIQNSIHVS